MSEDEAHASHPAVALRLKRALIHDQIDHCVTSGGVRDLAEIKAMTRLL